MSCSCWSTNFPVCSVFLSLTIEDMPWSRDQPLGCFSGSFLLLLFQGLCSPLCDISSDPFLILQHRHPGCKFPFGVLYLWFFSSQTYSSYLTLWPFPIRIPLHHSLAQQNFSEMLSSLSASTSSSPFFSHIHSISFQTEKRKKKCNGLSRATHCHMLLDLPIHMTKQLALRSPEITFSQLYFV